MKHKENSVSSMPKEGHSNSINKINESDVLKKPKLLKDSSANPEVKFKDSSVKPKEIKSSVSFDSHNHSSSKSKDHITNNKSRESSNNKDGVSIKPKESSSFSHKHKEISSGSKKPVDGHSASVIHKESSSGSSKSKEVGSGSNKPKEATIIKSKDTSNSNLTHKIKESGEKSSSHVSNVKAESIKLKPNSDKLNNSAGYKSREDTPKDVKVSSKGVDKSEIKKSSSAGDPLMKKVDKHSGDLKVGDVCAKARISGGVIFNSLFSEVQLKNKNISKNQFNLLATLILTKLYVDYVVKY